MARPLSGSPNALLLIVLLSQGVAGSAGATSPGASRATASDPEKAGSSRRPLKWRVERGVEALSPAARVRLVFVNDLPEAAVSAEDGVIQTAVCLYREGSEAAARLADASMGSRLTLAPEDPLLRHAEEGRPALRVTVEPTGIGGGDAVRTVVLGPPPRVILPDPGARPHGDVEAAGLRPDPASLEDRRRWDTGSRILPDAARLLWEGNVPADVDRVWIDYLAVTAPRPSGPLLVRPAPPRSFVVKLDPTARNRITLRAYLDATGSFRVGVDAFVEAPDEQVPRSP